MSKLFEGIYTSVAEKDEHKRSKEYKKLSISQLKKWKLKYHQIIFGKPSYDIFVDDLAFGFKKNWQSNFKKLLKSMFSKF